MHRRVPGQDRFFGSDYYTAVYAEVEHERDTLKHHEETLQTIAEAREEFLKAHPCRELVPFMENNGITVGQKNKSIFRNPL